MEEKNNDRRVMVSIVIAVLVLIIITIGGTFAYFSVQVNNNAGTTSVRATLADVGTVSFNSSENTNLSMIVSTEQMIKGSSDITYYAQAGSDMPATVEETTPTIATISVEGNGTYSCDYTLTISATSTGTNMYTAFQSMSGKSTDQIKLIVNTENTNTLDFNTANLFTNRTITGTFSNLTQSHGASITAQLLLVNKYNLDQSALAGSDISINIVPTSFSCTLVS